MSLNVGRDIMNFILDELPQKRQYWMFEYEQKWFDQIIANQFDTIYKELWRKEFCMSPGTFNFIVAQARQEMDRKSSIIVTSCMKT